MASHAGLQRPEVLPANNEEQRFVLSGEGKRKTSYDRKKQSSHEIIENIIADTNSRNDGGEGGVEDYPKVEQTSIQDAPQQSSGPVSSSSQSYKQKIQEERDLRNSSKQVAVGKNSSSSLDSSVHQDKRTQVGKIDRYNELVSANSAKNNQIWIKGNNVVRVPRQIQQEESQLSMDAPSLQSNPGGRALSQVEQDKQQLMNLGEKQASAAFFDDLEKYRSIQA